MDGSSYFPKLNENKATFWLDGVNLCAKLSKFVMRKSFNVQVYQIFTWNKPETLYVACAEYYEVYP